MTTHRSLLAATTTIILLASNVAYAGPWTKGQGELYAKVGQSVYLGDRGSSVGADVGSNYVGHTTSLYGEFGLGKRLQLNTSVPFTVASQEGSDGVRRSTAGLSDANVGLQWSPFKVPFALGVGTSVPLYSIAGADDQSPTLGDGQMNQRFTASYGLAIPALQAFASAGVGYEHRSSIFVGPKMTEPPNYSDGFVWNAQFGRTFFNLPILSLSASGVVPFENDTITKAYVSTGLAAYVPVARHVAVEAGAFVTPWARNSSRGATFTAGVSFRR